jgi:hypothetical protein
MAGWQLLGKIRVERKHIYIIRVEDFNFGVICDGVVKNLVIEVLMDSIDDLTRKHLSSSLIFHFAFPI